MFEHSVRVPRHYKVAANIFKKVSTEGGSVKTLLYDNKLRHYRTNVLYALITETIKHAAEIDKIFENIELLKKEPRLDPWVAKVLTTELLFGKKSLPGQSKPEQTVLSYKEQFEKFVNENQDENKTEDVLNLRGSDIEYNPVFFSYLVITPIGIKLFWFDGQLSPTVLEHFARENVEGLTCYKYEEVVGALTNMADLVDTQEQGLTPECQKRPCLLKIKTVQV